MQDGKEQSASGYGALTWLGGAAAGVAVGAVIWFATVGPGDKTKAPAPPAPAVVASSAPAPAAPAKPQPTPEAPRFDTVRAEADGSVLVAGQAPGAAKLTVMVDGTAAASADVDAQGKFAAFLTIGPSDKPRVVTLQAAMPDGTAMASADNVILAPMPAAPTPPVAAATTPPVAAATTPEVAAATETGSAPADTATNTAPATTDTAAAAPDVLIADDQGVRKLTADAPVAAVVIDTIGYDRLGNVDIAGRGAPDGFVRLYLDNAAMATAPLGDAGKWRMKLTGVAAGVYTLRVDQIDDIGKVTSRAETPFQREEPAKIAAAALGTDAGSAVASAPTTSAAAPAPTEPTAAPAPTEPTAAETAPAPELAAAPALTAVVVTVQPGSTLWAIARQSYGDGMLYVRVFEANKGQIKDPDLIYPGQVFSVPQQGG